MLNMKGKMVLQPHTTQGMTTSRKTVIIFSTFGFFGVMLASFFIFNLVDLPNTKGPILVKNPSFEKWRKNRPVGWEHNNAGIFIENNYHIEGQLAVGIFNEGKERRGISQSIKLDPNEIYNIYFNMKSNTNEKDVVGVDIQYTGEDVRTTTDVDQGVHLHEKGKEWEQYFGRVTGAKGITLFFFTSNNAIAYVDMVAVGVDVVPEAIGSSPLPSLEEDL